MKFSLGYKSVERQTNKAQLHFLKVAVCLFFLSLLAVKPAFSQSFNPLISFSVESCSLDVALEKLFAEYELNVAFSKAELSKIRIEKYSCSYKSVEEVLGDLLKGTDYGFKRIGNQYVVRKNIQLQQEIPNTQQEVPVVVKPVKETILQKADTVVNKTADTVRIYDTLQIIRTVMRYDTVVRVEQVEKTDTVYAVKYRGLEIHWPEFKDNGWFISPSVSFGFPHLDYVDKVQADSGSIRLVPISAFGIGLDAGHKSNRFSIGMSLAYRSVKYRFSLEQTVFAGDYYVSDTLDTYYVVHPASGDTAYFYILDSLYVPLETTNYSYRDVNRLDYLSVGLFASFDFWKREHFRMFVKAGASLDFLLSASGSYNSVEHPYHFAISTGQAAPVKLSYHLGAGAAFKVVKQLELVPEVTFRKTLGSVYTEDFPFDMQMRMWDFRLGLTYYF